MSETEIRPERVQFEGRGVKLIGERWPSQSARGLALLLHGGGQTRHSWSGTAVVLARQGWTTVALDARGHGESSWATEGNYGADALVDDLELVVRALGSAPVLIGASMGGLTALLAEGERGPLARSLVLVDIVPRIEPAGAERIVRFMTQHLDGFASLEEVADAVHAYNPHRARPAKLDGLKKNVRQRADGRWYWHWDPALMKPRLDEPTRAVGAERLLAAASRVRVPTLVVRGGRSDVVSVEGVNELLERLPHGRYVDVEAAGHMVAGDENDAFTRSIVEHLTDLEAS
jgi:pimeloyl-ACP methyl ester carboxylesterase